MYNLNDDTGEITIDFPDFGTVTIKHLKFGAYRRIRAERVRIAQEGQDRMLELPDLAPLPDAGDTSATAAEDRIRLNAAYQARILEIQDITSERLTAIWRFILIGDESFAGAATPRPPEDTDEWPAEMFVDGGMLDAVMAHLGKAHRSRSGPTQNGTQPVQHPLVAP